MSPKLHDLLCDRYPAIFRDRYGEKRHRALRWCAEHGDGWFVLIDTLCDEIQRHVDAHAEEIAATKIKSFLGGLSFYYRDPNSPNRCIQDEYIDGLVRMAEAISHSLCRICGSPAMRRRPPGNCWLEVSCPEHGGPSGPIGAEASAPSQNLTHLSLPGVPWWRVGLVFRLPPIKNPGWRHLAQALEEMIDLDVRYHDLKPVVVDQVIETENLAFRWMGGDQKGRTAGYFRLVEAYSLRCSAESGRVTAHFRR